LVAKKLFLSLGEKSDITFGDAIKQIRLRKGLSCRAISELCGFSPAYFSKIENNSTIPSSKALVKIFTKLDCTEKEMLYIFGILNRNDDK